MLFPFIYKGIKSITLLIFFLCHRNILFVSSFIGTRIPTWELTEIVSIEGRQKKKIGVSKSKQMQMLPLDLEHSKTPPHHKYSSVDSSFFGKTFMLRFRPNMMISATSAVNFSLLTQNVKVKLEHKLAIWQWWLAIIWFHYLISTVS